MRVGELEGSDCSAVPVPGMYSLANGENVSWRSAGGDGGIRLVRPSSAENVGGDFALHCVSNIERGNWLEAKASSIEGV
jgi:hypothetical protein